MSHSVNNIQDGIAREQEKVDLVVEEIKPTQYEQDDDEDASYFGDLLPYCDPSWYQGSASPYYNRKFADPFGGSEPVSGIHAD